MESSPSVVQSTAMTLKHFFYFLLFRVLLVEAHLRTLSRPSSRFLHITDIHIDPYYVSGDSGSHCHGKMSIRNSHAAGHFGAVSENCDTPNALVEDVFLNFIRGKWGSWAPSTEEEVSFVLWTGDTARHGRDNELPRSGEENYAQISLVSAYFQQAFNLSQTIVIPSIGNIDAFVPDNFRKGPNEELEKLREIWRPFLMSSLDVSEQDSILSDFLRGGYHKRRISAKLDVVSLNTLYFFNENNFICAGQDYVDCDCSPALNTTHPGDVHLEWLQLTLQASRKKGAKVILSGHIPPVNDENDILYRHRCWKHFASILLNFNDTVTGSFFGHINKDMLILLHDTQDPIFTAVTSKNVAKLPTDIGSLLFVSPSIIPATNPAVRLFTCKSEGLKFWETWFVDLEKENQVFMNQDQRSPLSFHLEYNSLETYGVGDLGPAGVLKLVNLFRTSEKKRDIYLKYLKVPGAEIPPDFLRLDKSVVWTIMTLACLAFLTSMGIIVRWSRRSKDDALDTQLLLSKSIRASPLSRIVE